MCLGQKVDVPLCAEGILQAKRLAGIFERVDFEQVFSSPLLRAKQTAEYIAAQKHSLHTLDALMELDGGVWDGMMFDEIHKRYPQYFVPGAAVPPPPGGESDEQGLARAYAALKSIEKRMANSAVVVSHSGLNRVLLSALMGRSLSLKKRIHQEYACISVLRCEQGIWRVKEAGITLEEWTGR